LAAFLDKKVKLPPDPYPHIISKEYHHLAPCAIA